MSSERVNYRNGYRPRPFDTRVGTVELAIPKLRRGSYLPDWLLDDVEAFPGHIACDSRSKSEIVTPVLDASGALIAVFDVDSDQPAAFDEVDQQGIHSILKATFAG